jgi:cell division protein FtsQ
MPLEMVDPDDEDPPRFRGPSAPWWRPASTVGRVFLGLGVLIVLGGLATAGILFKTYIARDARFRIAGAGSIQATGLTEVSRAEMLPVFGEDIGRNIFFVPLAERRKQLEEIPWVERATVMRLLPDQIRVAVVERQPVAFTRQGHEVGLVDGSGVLLAMPAATMAQHHYSFPVVTGIDPRDPIASRKARMAMYARLLAELDANNQHLSEQISEIDLTDPEDARVLMPEQGADILAHFGEDHFLERYQRYKAHIAEWRQQYPKLAAVDLRYDQQVVLEMQPGTNAVAAAVAEPTTPDTDTSKTADAPPPETAQDKPKPGLSAGETPSKPAPSKPAATPGRSEKPGAEPAGSSSSRPQPGGSSKSQSTGGMSPAARALTARDKAAKAAKVKKKRAEAKRAALNAGKHKPAPTRPAAVGAAVAAEGQ